MQATTPKGDRLILLVDWLLINSDSKLYDWPYSAKKRKFETARGISTDFASEIGLPVSLDSYSENSSNLDSSPSAILIK